MSTPAETTSKYKYIRTDDDEHDNSTVVTDGEEDNAMTLKDLESLLDTTVLSNAITTTDGQIDWSQYSHMMMYHARKAGGSSLFYWAREVAKKHNLTIHQQEGTAYDPHDWKLYNHNHNNNNKHRMGPNRVFVFTSLRPPVDRVISSYEYDGVQTSKNPNTSNGTTLTLQEFFHHANQVNDYGKNSRTVKRQGVMNRRRYVKVKRGWIWKCATNCYSKWFGGWPQPDLIPDTPTAVHRLDELEIFWMDSYKDTQYMEWLLHRWNATDIPMIHRRKTKDNAKQNYTTSDWNMLQESNQNDQLLYEALRNKWSKLLNRSLA